MGKVELPTPFGGITHKITLTELQFPLVLASFAIGCGKGHGHNFAVETDGRSIYTTQLGVECINNLIEMFTDTAKEYGGTGQREVP